MVWFGDRYYLTAYPSFAYDSQLFEEWLHSHSRADERHYFGFVEDVSAISNRDAIDAPDGGFLKPDNPVFENDPIRFRLSGVSAPYFLKRLNEFDQLELGTVSAEQRARRRSQLREFYEGALIPVIDIYASRDQDDFGLLRRRLTPSSWHHIIFREGNARNAESPVYLGEPDPRYPGDFMPGELRAVLPIGPAVEERLRDIFSLNHVPDAATDERPEGGSAPHSLPPPDPPPPSPVDLDVDRVDLDPDETVDAPTAVAISVNEEDEDPQYLTQST